MIAEECCACVEDTKEYNQAGDIFQLVTSQRFGGKLIVKGITNWLLASTCHFGLTPEEDRQLEEDHVAYEKEYTEHVMLVDLGSSEQNFCGLD